LTKDYNAMFETYQDKKYVLVDELLEYFQDKKYVFSVNTCELIELLKNKIIDIYKELEKKIEIIILRFDPDLKGYLDFLSFDKLMQYTLQNDYDNLKWKIGEFFR